MVRWCSATAAEVGREEEFLGMKTVAFCHSKHLPASNRGRVQVIGLACLLSMVLAFSAPALAENQELDETTRRVISEEISYCWNVGWLTTEALETSVLIQVEMGEDTRPNENSIRLLISNGPNEKAEKQAFEAARRAIVRCGSRRLGFLEMESFDAWHTLTIEFSLTNSGVTVQ